MKSTSLTDSQQAALERVFDKVSKEREYQIGRWGTEADERHNKPNDWVTYITGYAAKWLPGNFAPYSRKTLEDFQTSMLKVATIAFAAIVETDKILAGFNDRPDVLDPDDGFETTSVTETTKNVPLAIVASNLRKMGINVRFMDFPVGKYRNQVLEAATVPWDGKQRDYGMFAQYEGMTVYLYRLANNNGALSDTCMDVTEATMIRFDVL